MIVNNNGNRMDLTEECWGLCTMPPASSVATVWADQGGLSVATIVDCHPSFGKLGYSKYQCIIHIKPI